ncbi:MAG: ABC transporter substrate-binding protein [Acidobacteriota bacterium]
MIPVGISISLTGKYREQGQDALNGLRLWEQHVNSRGGLVLPNTSRRETISLRYVDDRSKVEQCRRNVEGLIRNGIDLLIGPYSSALTGAAAGAACGEGKILWNHGGACERTYRDYASSVISVVSPARTYLQDLPDYILHRELPVKKLAVMFAARRGFPAEVASGLADSCARHALEIAPVDISDRRIELLQLIRAALDQDPECLVAIGDYQEEISIFKYSTAFPQISLAVCIAAGVSAFYKELKEMAERVVGPSQWEPDTAPRPDLGPDETWFRHQYYGHFRKTPDYTAAQAFACGLILEKCVGDSADLSAPALRAVALRQDLSTFYGRFRLDSNGAQNGHKPLLVQWESGRKQVVWPPLRTTGRGFDRDP